MMTLQKTAAVLLLCLLNTISKSQIQPIHNADDHIIVRPDEIKWVDGPQSLPAGAKRALLEGDPKDSGLFTMRLLLPANFKIMPHRHLADEHITVIKGSFYMGVGEKFSKEAMMQIPTGGFAVMLKGTAHYGYAREACIIQVHGEGPWVVNYVNPGDDPRKRK